MSIQDMVLDVSRSCPPGAVFHNLHVRQQICQSFKKELTYKQARDALYRLRYMHPVEHLGQGWYEWLW